MGRHEIVDRGVQDFRLAQTPASRRLVWARCPILPRRFNATLPVIVYRAEHEQGVALAAAWGLC